MLDISYSLNKISCYACEMFYNSNFKKIYEPFIKRMDKNFQDKSESLLTDIDRASVLLNNYLYHCLVSLPDEIIRKNLSRYFQGVYYDQGFYSRGFFEFFLKTFGVRLGGSNGYSKEEQDAILIYGMEHMGSKLALDEGFVAFDPCDGRSFFTISMSVYKNGLFFIEISHKDTSNMNCDIFSDYYEKLSNKSHKTKSFSLIFCDKRSFDFFSGMTDQLLHPKPMKYTDLPKKNEPIFSELIPSLLKTMGEHLTDLLPKGCLYTNAFKMLLMTINKIKDIAQESKSGGNFVTNFEEKLLKNKLSFKEYLSNYSASGLSQ